MKKGDVIQKLKIIETGDIVIGNIDYEHDVDKFVASLPGIYGRPIDVECVADPHNKGKFALASRERVTLSVEAKINWIVDYEAGVTYVEDEGMAVVDVRDGWTVIFEATPEYQTSVEHLSDDELRASIEGLRGARVARPKPVAKAKGTRAARQPAMTAEEKSTASVLAKLTPEQREKLMKKLGMID